MPPEKKWTGERWETGVYNETALEHLHRYALAVELSAGKAVLDIACGEGYGSALLARNAVSVTGMDIDPVCIEKAKKKYVAGNLRFVAANALSTTLPDQTFDLVVSFETLEHLDEQDQLLRELKRVLKPGGLLLISTPDKAQYTDQNGYRNPFHKKELYKTDFDTLLRQYFNHVTLLSQSVCHSSVIRTGSSTGFDVYTGNEKEISKNGVENALYLVAIASDNDLPELNNSIFNGRSILQAALEEQERTFRNTITYRLGHTLLLPFKWIKKRFE